MTLKAIIIEELLATVDGPSQVQKVFQRYRGSKGPLYSVLAEATYQLQQNVEEMLEEADQVNAYGQRLREEVAVLEGQRREQEANVQALDQQKCTAETKLGEMQSALDQAEQLASRGFGEMELDRLYTLLGEVAGAHGMPPEQGVASFFECVGRYEQVITLDLKSKGAEARAAQAKAEGDRWEAECQRKEASSKGRMDAVDLTQQLMGQGMTADELLQLGEVVVQTKVSTSDLAAGLEKVGSIEDLVKSKQAHAEELQVEVEQLENQVKSLTQEKRKVVGAIKTINETGLREIENAAEAARRRMEDLTESAIGYGRLQAQAQELGRYVEAARLMKSGDPQSWQKLPRNVIHQFLLIILSWSEVEGRDPQVTVPTKVHQASLLPSYAKLKLSQVLLWAFAGTLTRQDLESIVN